MLDDAHSHYLPVVEFMHHERLGELAQRLVEALGQVAPRRVWKEHVVLHRSLRHVVVQRDVVHLCPKEHPGKAGCG